MFQEYPLSPLGGCVFLVLVIALRWGKLQMRKKNTKLLSVVVDVIIYVDNPTES